MATEIKFADLNLNGPQKLQKFNYLFQIPQNEESNKDHFEDHLLKKGKNIFDLKNIREWGRDI